MLFVYSMFLITTAQAQYDFFPVPAPAPPQPVPVARGPPAPSPPPSSTAARPAQTPHRGPSKSTRGPALPAEREEAVKTVPGVRCSVSDVLFVLDATGSVRAFFEQQKSYIVDVVEQMNIGPTAQHVGLILYSSKQRKRIIVPLDEMITKEEFIAKVRALPFYSGVTATGAALELSLKALEQRRRDKNTAVVVLTDGYSFDHVEEGARKLNSLQNTVVYVAGVPDPYGLDEIEIIAGDGSRVFIGNEAKAKLISKLRC